jgi:hypothetical protein
MPTGARYLQAASEGALGLWGNAARDLVSDQPLKVVEVRHGNAVVQALTLPKQFLTQVQRALCLGRNHLQLIKRTKKTRRMIRIVRGETLAGLATLEFRIGLKKDAMKRHDTGSVQQNESLADLHSSLERRRIDMETLYQAELKLNDELKEGFKGWEKA